MMVEVISYYSSRIPRAILIATACFVLSGGCAGSPYSEYNRGLQLIQNGDPIAGESALLRSLTVQTDNAEAWNQLGILAFDRGDWTLASERFKTAVHFDPLSGVYARNYGLTFAAKGDYPDARQWMRKSLELDPQNADTLAALAKIYYLDGDYKAARNMAREALESEPANSDAAKVLSLLPNASE